MSTPLLFLLSLSSPMNGDAHGAWAIGYAAAVERACPRWRRLPPAELARRGVLSQLSIADWGPDGPLADRYWRGTEQAARDRRTFGLCRSARWPTLVRQVLTTGTTPPSRN